LSVAARKLGNIATDNLPRHTVWISTRVM
jgi:hypothetical protein